MRHRTRLARKFAQLSPLTASTSGSDDEPLAPLRAACDGGAAEFVFGVSGPKRSTRFQRLAPSSMPVPSAAARPHPHWRLAMSGLLIGYARVSPRNRIPPRSATGCRARRRAVANLCRSRSDRHQPGAARNPGGVGCLPRRRHARGHEAGSAGAVAARCAGDRRGPDRTEGSAQSLRVRVRPDRSGRPAAVQRVGDGGRVEADLIRSRTLEGTRVAKAKGRLRVKQPKLNPRQEAHMVELLKRPRKPPPPGSKICGYCGGTNLDRVKLTNSCRHCGGRGWVR